MKHKVAELEGALLDAAVAKAHGQSDDVVCEVAKWAGAFDSFAPSSVWDHGDPIIQRERIRIDAFPKDWTATLGGWAAVGPTPLIAAMRAYVASKFGDEVELP